MTASVAPVGTPAAALDQTFSFWNDSWRRFRKNKLAIAGLVVVALLLVMSVFAEYIAPHGYNEQFIGPSQGEMSRAFPFGTDTLGRDMLSRIIFGARISLTTALLVVLLSTVVSFVMGGLAGFFGGFLDTVIMRFADSFLAIPYILVGFAMVETFGRSLIVVVASLVVRSWMSSARVFRAQILQVKALDYVEAARAVGAGKWRILVQHVFPNASQLLIVSIGLSIGAAVLTESVYSFLGVGFQDPTPSWGVMVADGRSFITSKPHLFFFPAGALMITVLAFMFVAEGIRDAFDPKLR